ncbi:hypothetical protein, partial [Klebsiella pneumoniae]|uniref:hypothetical protein n=1 Tax=Klebsiella pneumoniae TaxID=573 RepID=UPI003A88E5DF
VMLSHEAQCDGIVAVGHDVVQWRFLQFSDEARRWLNLRKETSCYGLAPVVFRSISHFKRLFSQMPPAISSRVLNVFGVDYKSHLPI